MIGALYQRLGKLGESDGGLRWDGVMKRQRYTIYSGSHLSGFKDGVQNEYMVYIVTNGNTRFSSRPLKCLALDATRSLRLSSHHLYL